MSSPRTTIEELEQRGAIVEIQDGNHGELHPKATEYTPTGIPFIMASDLRDNRIDLDTGKRLPQSRTDQLRIGFARTGDVLLTHKGTVGQVAIVPPVAPYVMLTPQVTYYRVNENELCSRYLAHAFRSPAFQQQLQSQSAQSTRPYIGITAQRRLKIPWFPLDIQRRIASILSAYDDLVENNTRRIVILEEMARQLFEEWFVRFRFPGHESIKLVKSEIGEVPEAWDVVRLGQVADVKWGDTTTTKRAYANEGYDAYSATGLDGKLDHFDFHRDGIVLSAIGAHCGRTWFARGQWSCIKNTIRFWSTDEDLGNEYLFLATLGQGYWPRRGAAQPFISQGDARMCKLLKPSRDVEFRFRETAAPSLRLAHCLNRKNINLRAQRDLLLLRLISGEIDVSDIGAPEKTAAA